MNNNETTKGYTFEQFRDEFMKTMQSKALGTPIDVATYQESGDIKIPIVVQYYEQQFPELNGTLEFSIVRPMDNLDDDTKILGINFFLHDHTKEKRANDQLISNSIYDSGATNSLDVHFHFKKNEEQISYSCFVVHFDDSANRYSVDTAYGVTKSSFQNSVSSATGKINFEDIPSFLAKYPGKISMMFNSVVKPLDSSRTDQPKRKFGFKFTPHTLTGPASDSHDRPRRN